MKPASHRVILNEQCCATCRHLDALRWLCLAPGRRDIDFRNDRILRPELEVCDEWEG